MSAVATVADYAAIFERERLVQYPVVDAFERRMGYAIDRAKLEKAARVLACPLKKSPPNWQHGRVIYSAIRNYVGASWNHNLLDVGTAKGFSALCMAWAMADSQYPAVIVSVDVLDPHERVRRNTVAEAEGPKTLSQILAQWPESQSINFIKSTGQKWLQEHPARVHVAFIDGKHSYEAVSWEAALLAERQQTGDLAIFDDAQIDGVAKALKELRSYELEYLEVLPTRRYAIGRRK
jgi:predicted O-methyltransferase YrrM